MRFQIALSFPGEHRSRVEAIATALALDLGKEAILYDKWYEAEFALPNLDKYLEGLYRDRSRLLVFFHCEEYDKSEWCGVEDRVGRELRMHGQDQRLMYLRLDQPKTPSIDGYIDISARLDAEVATQILKRLRQLDPVAIAPSPIRTFTSNLPAVDTLLIGRDTELAFLEKAWSDSANIVQIIAPGGTGKTALMDKWFRHHLNEVTIFGWSFYSQGTQQDRQTSSDPFFAEIIPFFSIKIPEGATVYARAEAIAQRLREEKVLLILDGLEPLQESTGEVRDSPMKALLHELRTRNKGMVLCTTRVQMKDLPVDKQSPARNLENLTLQDGASLLRTKGVEGTQEELEEASEDFHNHALAVTLLGTYLKEFHNGDIRSRSDIRGLLTEESDTDGHANRVMAAYVKMFQGKPELEVLRALGYFDRPAEPEALRLLLKKTPGQLTLIRLKKLGLLLTSDPGAEIDCHPLAREYFAKVMRENAAEEFKAHHSLLYEHYSKQAPEKPETRETMVPLFHAVYHGCQAGRYAEACDNDLPRPHSPWRRPLLPQRRTSASWGTNLSLVANFFQDPWRSPVEALLPLINRGSHKWRSAPRPHQPFECSGRLRDAVAPMPRVRRRSDTQTCNNRTGPCRKKPLQPWGTSKPPWAICLKQSSQLEAPSSMRIEAWKTFAGQRDAVPLAGISHLRATSQRGAPPCFEEAEDLQKKGESQEYPFLYASCWDYNYCDLLLDQGKQTEVLRRATAAPSDRPERNSVPWTIGLLASTIFLLVEPTGQSPLNRAITWTRPSTSSAAQDISIIFPVRSSPGPPTATSKKPSR